MFIEMAFVVIISFVCSNPYVLRNSIVSAPVGRLTTRVDVEYEIQYFLCKSVHILIVVAVAQ